jgi:hypothetical protein
MKGPRRLEPLQTERKKKRKKKRYLKQLSSRVGITEDYYSKTEYSESGGNRSIKNVKSKRDVSQNSPRDPDLSRPGERNSTSFFYCRFIVKFPIIAFCKYAFVHYCCYFTVYQGYYTGFELRIL